MALTPSGDFTRYLAQNYYTKTELQAGALDTIYYGEDEFIATSAGAGDAGKPIKLDAAGHVDATMVNDADIDHGTVGGLTDDDHSQYALLIGRSGGTTLRGGTGSADNLALYSTSHATKGKLLLGAANAAYDEANVRLGIGTASPSTTLHLSSASTSGTLQRLEATDTGGKTYVLASTGSASTGGAGKFQLVENTSGNRLTYDGVNDRLGVGAVTSPTVTLDVLGNVLITGNVTITGTQTGGATASLTTHESDTSTHGVAVAIVGTTETQTLTNKTLTAPVIATISNTGTLTLPTSTDTLVGRATTDTLTNKTLTSPTLTTPTIASFANATHTHAAAASGGTIAHSVLTGLTTGDPHTQYVLLAGRSGGTTLYGGPDSGDDLILDSTSHASKGTISLNSAGGIVTIGNAAGEHRFSVWEPGSNYHVTLNINESGVNYLNSYNSAAGVFTGAPLALFGSRVSINQGIFNIDTGNFPASASANGTAGDIAWNSTHVAVCVSANTWKRVAIATW
jgi:hypothetical protein